MSSGMKTLAWIVAIIAVAVAAVFMLVAVLLPRDMLKTRIGEQIAAWTGREVSLRGDPVISVFPHLRVSLDDVEVGGPQGMEDAAILSMDRLEGQISLLPLIIGRVEVDSFVMVRPRLRLIRDAEGQRNWAFDAGAAAVQLAFAGDVPLGEFRLVDATILYEDRQNSDAERLDSVNLTVDWKSVRNPIAVEGSGIWRGEEVRLSGGAEKPFAYLNGSTTPVDARIEAAPISIVLTGEARDYPRMQLSGALKLKTPSLRRFVAWLGGEIRPGATLGETSLFGTASLSDNVLSVSDAQFVLDGNAASGALKIVLGAKPDIGGTLAFGALDLTPYFTGISTALSLGPDWRRVSLTTDWFSDIGVDVRLSAESVKFGALTAGGTAASVSLRDHRLEIGLARATFESGSLSGDLSISEAAVSTGSGSRKAEVMAQLRATDISLAAAAPILSLPNVSGVASIAVDLTATGGDLGSVVNALAGTASFKVIDGRIPLFGLPEMVAAEDAAAGGTAPPATDGLAPTPVQTAAAALSIAGGIGTLDDARIVTDSYAASARGWVNLVSGAVRLSGTLEPGAPGDVAGAAAPFTIEGTLSEPIVQRQALAN